MYFTFTITAFKSRKAKTLVRATVLLTRASILAWTGDALASDCGNQKNNYTPSLTVNQMSPPTPSFSRANYVPGKRHDCLLRSALNENSEKNDKPTREERRKEVNCFSVDYTLFIYLVFVRNSNRVHGV